MLSEHVRRRLEQLNRRSLPASAKRNGATKEKGKKTIARVVESLPLGDLLPKPVAKQKPAATEPTLDLSSIDNPRLAEAVANIKTYEPQTLEEVAPGEVVEGPAGNYYLIDRPLESIWPQSEKIIAAAQERIAATRGEQYERHNELAAFVDHFPDGVMFLDLETCGFAGSMVFLTGLLCQVDGQLTLRQLFARDYAEEAAMFAALWQTAADNPVLATFNGKTFDWPVVHDRSTLHHQGRDMRYAKPQGANAERADSTGATAGPVETLQSSRVGEKPDSLEPPPLLGRRDPRPNPIHFDLLHHSRRRWKQVLPNCKLQTLERFLCGRARQGDIPGGDIPVAYHEYVRSGDARQIGDILHHNALDLVTLLQVSLQMI